MSEPRVDEQGDGNVAPAPTPGDSAALPTAPEEVKMIPVTDLNAYKSATDKRIQALQYELGERNRADNEAKLAAIEDPTERRAAELEIQVQELQRRTEAADLAEQKRAALQRISNVSGVPASVLDAATDEATAWELAFQYKSATTPAGTPTPPALGTTPAPKKRDFVAEIQEAKAAGDSRLVSQLTREAREFLNSKE